MSTKVKRAIFALVLYFAGYMFILPLLLKRLIAITGYKEIILLITYGVYLYLMIYLFNNELYTGLLKLKNHVFSFIGSLLKRFGLLLLVSFIGNMILVLVFGMDESENQQIVIEALYRFPISTIFSILFFAPVTEELVFRHCIRTVLPDKMPVIIKALISGLLFGGIHVIDSVIHGNIIELLYIPVYGGLGMIIYFFYEKENNIDASISLHFVNNLFSLIMMII